jgi:hypothetical protein
VSATGIGPMKSSTIGLGVAILVAAVAAALFIGWLVRARANAEHLGPHRHTAGWAIPGWFVPFANLAVPGRVVADVWRASPTPRQQYVSTALVTAWWLTATGTWLLYVVGMALRIDTSAPPASSVGGRAAGVEPARATHDRTQRSGALSFGPSPAASNTASGSNCPAGGRPSLRRRRSSAAVGGVSRSFSEYWPAVRPVPP